MSANHASWDIFFFQANWADWVLSTSDLCFQHDMAHQSWMVLTMVKGLIRSKLCHKMEGSLLISWYMTSNMNMGHLFEISCLGEKKHNWFRWFGLSLLQTYAESAGSFGDLDLHECLMLNFVFVGSNTRPLGLCSWLNISRCTLNIAKGYTFKGGQASP